MENQAPNIPDQLTVDSSDIIVPYFREIDDSTELLSTNLQR